MNDDEYLRANFAQLSPELQELARIVGIEPEEKIKDEGVTNGTEGTEQVCL